VEVGRALQVQEGLDRIVTRRVQADFSEWRVAQSDSRPSHVADHRRLECHPWTVDCSGHLESADRIGADAGVASSGGDQVALMAGEAAVSY
jgi:hypothetical protein